MGLDHRPGDAQHHGAPHFLHVQHLFHLGQIALQNGGGQLVLQVLIEHGFQIAHHEFNHALGGFQHQVAGKAVGHEHVHITGENPIALHVADEVDAAGLPGRFQQLEGLMLQDAALGILGAYIGKAHTGVLQAQHGPGIEAAHIGKLQ